LEKLSEGGEKPPFRYFSQYISAVAKSQYPYAIFIFLLRNTVEARTASAKTVNGRITVFAPIYNVRNVDFVKGYGARDRQNAFNLYIFKRVTEIRLTKTG